MVEMVYGHLNDSSLIDAVSALPMAPETGNIRVTAEENRQAFAFFQPMTPEQVALAERMVNVLPANTDGPENTDGNPNGNGAG